MIDIAAYIGRLVREHELVIIPGLGGFLTNFHASAIHALSNRIEPPGRHIAFNTRLQENDGLLANHLQKKLDLSYKDALVLVETFAEFCKTELDNGQNISFENLGILSLNARGNIEFSPNLSINYADEYFGLPDIIAPRIQRKKQHEAVIQFHPHAKEKIKSHAPLIRKIAAIAIPFIFLSVFAYFSKDEIKNIYQQSASVFSFSSDSSNEISNEETLNIANDVKDKQADLPFETAKETVEEEPIVVVNVETDSEIVYNESPVVENGNFHIICGAFNNKDLADKLILQLDSEGFKSYLAGQNATGLYRVSASNFSNRLEAVEQLRWYQANRNKEAWLLVEEL